MEPVHPRASGERRASGGQNSTSTGSSPRERGTGLMLHRGVRVLRFIPARAGNGLPGDYRRAWTPVHPRASGERSAISCTCASLSGSSPRERGTGPPENCYPVRERFIPARAGNGQARWVGCRCDAVHPRASGERREGEAAKRAGIGSSPRERGTVSAGIRGCITQRFIPARAGNGCAASPRSVR